MYFMSSAFFSFIHFSLVQVKRYRQFAKAGASVISESSFNSSNKSLVSLKDLTKIRTKTVNKVSKTMKSCNGVQCPWRKQHG